MRNKVYLIAILCICMFISGKIALDQNRMTQFTVNGGMFSVSIEIDDKSEKVLPWYDEDEQTYYFFFPSCVTSRRLYFDSINDDNLAINNSIVSGRSCLLWEPGEIYTFEIEGERYRVTFMKSENIPAFFMETNSGSTDYIYADKHNEERGSLTAIGADRVIQYHGGLNKIKMRGNTTVLQEKKPYSIELVHPTALCGMESGKNWKLFSLYFEQDKIHSKLIFDMAREIGLVYTPESFATNLEYLFKMKNPSFISQKETEEIANYVQEIETVIVMDDKKYREYIDLESLAKQFLIDKIVMEGDAMGLSTFFYIKNGILYAGPLWDYDRAMGERYPDYETPIDGPPNWMSEWYMALYQDEEFLHAMKESYLELLPYCKQLLENDIDKYADTISASVAMDSILMASYTTADETSDLRSYTKYESYIRYLKYFLANRLNYLNSLWGIYEYRFTTPMTTDTFHTVIFQLPDGTVVDRSEVVDGACMENLPELDDAEYKEGWYFLCREKGANKAYHYKIPVYEDMILYANKRGVEGQ